MNTNQTHTTKTTLEIKAQVLNDIQRIKDDFEEIKQRLTPGQLIDDAIYYRRGGGDITHTFEFLKNNPVGTSFLTIGTLLLMEDSDHVSMEKKAKTKAHDLKQSVRGKLHHSKISSIKEKIVEQGSEVIEKVKHLDPITYMVLGAGLGTMTGAAFPVSNAEERVMSGEFQNRFEKFRHELEEALNESANILKNEFVGHATKFDFKLF